MTSDSSLRSEICNSMESLLIEKNGLIFGHNLTDVGWVAGTIPPLPEHPGYIELPITDIAGVGIAVGAAISNRPIVFISRYQGYLWFNLAPLATYASVSRTVFNQDCWIMFRSIADDGALGPVASGTYLSLATQILGLRVVAPVTKLQWKEVWKQFLSKKDPMFVSEHRSTYEIDYEFEVHSKAPKVVVLSIGGTFINLRDVSSKLQEKKINHSAHSLLWISPIQISANVIEEIVNSSLCVILDPGSKDFGVGAGVQQYISELCQTKIIVIASKEKISGYSSNLKSSIASSETIVKQILKYLD
jgi:pyruvate/2-oxoglutarate/acetoin dehydrogenase E1 component